MLTTIPVPRRSQQPQCLLFYVTSHTAFQPISNAVDFPEETAPLQDAHHIWKMTYWGSRFCNIPFVLKRLSELRLAHLCGIHRSKCSFRAYLRRIDAPAGVLAALSGPCFVFFSPRWKDGALPLSTSRSAIKELRAAQVGIETFSAHQRKDEQREQRYGVSPLRPL